jgi:5'-phosphate synthase pdxT subunit
MALVGVIALQGGVSEHGSMMSSLGHQVRFIRDHEALSGVEAVILPGGESTTLLFLMKRWGLFEPLKKMIAGGLPVLGTCAGAVLLSRKVTERDHPVNQDSLMAADVEAQRNSFGRQVASFREYIDLHGMRKPFPGVFIRAPLLTPLNDLAVVMASVSEGAVFIRQGNVWLSSFHPELTEDNRIHRMFLRESGFAGA